MSSVELAPNEAILKQDSRMTHDRGKLSDSSEDELILTNFHLIVLHKGIFGKVKDVARFPLRQIKIVNGNPQIIVGKSSEGFRELQVHFTHGVENFILGESDDDEDDVSRKKKVSARQQREKQNALEWQEAITRAALGIPQALSITGSNTGGYMAGNTKQQGQTGSSILGGIIGGAMGGISAVTQEIASQIYPSSQANQAYSFPNSLSNNATAKCMGCMAPITGRQGERVICKYCDTEQVIH